VRTASSSGAGPAADRTAAEEVPKVGGTEGQRRWRLVRGRGGRTSARWEAEEWDPTPDLKGQGGVGGGILTTG